MNSRNSIDSRYSRVVIHFLKAVNETTGGYREFAVWRDQHIECEKNIVMVCGKRIDGNKKSCSEVEVIWGNGDVRRMRRRIEEILSICEQKRIPVIFHIQQFSAIKEIIKITLGLGVRKHMLYTMGSTYSGYTTNSIKCQCILSALYAKHLTFLSYASYEDYPKFVKWIKGKNMSVIEHGANEDEIGRIDWKKKKEILNQTLELVYTARIVPVKNHIFLLDVMEKVDGVHVSFIGDESSPLIQSEIRKRNLESKVSITGLLSREEVYKSLREADGYLSVSMVEGLPVSVLEAMHAGLPIILSDIKPHVELAQKTNGIAILPLKKELWIKKINDMKEMSLGQREKLGKENASVAARLFTLSRMHRRYDKLYRSLEMVK